MHVLALALLALVQDDGCRRCEHRGVVPCGRHSEESLEAESRVLFCAFAAACEDCRGTLVVDCKRCAGGPGTAEAGARRQAIEAWLPRDEVERFLGRDLMRVETERYRLVVESGPIQDGKKRIDAHVLAHHLADDVEFVARRLAQDFRLQPDEYRAKMRMWVWGDPKDHAAVMPEFLHASGPGEFGYLGRDPVLSSWTESPFFDEAIEVRTLFAHKAGHLLLSNVIRELWIGDLGGGWLDVAVGHSYEYERFGHTRNYCIEEATVPSNYAGGIWRAAVRARLEKEPEPFLPRVLKERPGAMRQEDQALCWSFLDYLRLERAEALRPILADYKAKREPREVLPDRLGASVLELEAVWRAWVKDRYPKKGDELQEAR